MRQGAHCKLSRGDPWSYNLVNFFIYRSTASSVDHVSQVQQCSLVPGSLLVCNMHSDWRWVGTMWCAGPTSGARRLSRVQCPLNSGTGCRMGVDERFPSRGLSQAVLGVPSDPWVTRIQVGAHRFSQWDHHPEQHI